MKNEMEYTDMIDILEHVNTYVPTQSMITTAAYPNPLIGSPVPIKHQLIHPLLFGGDQLTVARARGAKQIRKNSLNPSQKLEGLIPIAEDWHAKVCLLQVS